MWRDDETIGDDSPDEGLSGVNVTGLVSHRGRGLSSIPVTQDRLQRGGETFVSNAVLGGRYVLRACIVNFHTTEGDVEAVPESVVRMGMAIDAELRAGTIR